tara:strand:- start:374 stop:865 length:492 start_codon:yes stop_codon:yes gene_type:complete
MRIIYIIFFLFFSILINAQCSDLIKLREVYTGSHHDLKKCNELFNLSKKCDIKLDPVEFSYNILANLIKCNFLYNPLIKYKKFKDSTKLLDRMIHLNPQNTEIRFLRYLAQLNCPIFLGYRSDLEHDYKLIMSNIKSEDEDLKFFILSILNNLNNEGASYTSK